jgi:pimeloyl-ACP methyl ester carboxylesterase
VASFTVNGNRIFYEVKGEVTGEGPNLIFMHGLGADRRQAMATTQSLQSYRLICVDMPGHGDSEYTASETVSFSRYADVAFALLDKLEIDSAVWGGISMGSGIALHAALRCPERVDGLLLVRPAWLDKPGLPNLAIVSQVGEWIAELGLDQTRKKLIVHSSYLQAQTLSQHCADSIAGLLTRPQAVSAAGVLPTLVQDSPFQNIKQLAQLAMPAIVFGNQDDPLHPEIIAKRLADALPISNYINLPARYTQAKHHATQLTGLMQVFLTDLARKMTATIETSIETIIETK